MKKLFIIPFLFLTTLSFSSSAQETQAAEQYGKTLNLGLGLGYYGYVGHSVPVLHINYEFNVAKNFSLAPFISFYSNSNYSYWGNPDLPYRNYHYRETVVPIGVKGTYYFDQLLHAGTKWDFYLAGSLGFAIRSVTWDSGYYGNTNLSGTSPLYMDIHIGGEYHLSQKLGLFLDLSSGVSTVGLAIHH